MSGQDHLWVPRYVRCDSRLITSMCSACEKFSHDEISIAFEYLCSKESGLNKSQSLVDDLIEKSGPFAKPYIDRALQTLQTWVFRETLSTEIARVLLSELALFDDEFVIETQVYRGCLWELFSSFVVVLLSHQDPLAPASCFDTITRTRWIEEKILQSTKY